MGRLVKIPFDLEMSRKITSGEMEGRVVTRDGRCAKIILFDAKGKRPIVALIDGYDSETADNYTNDGHSYEGSRDLESDLILLVPEDLIFREGDLVVINEKQIGILENISKENSKYEVVVREGKSLYHNVIPFSASTIRHATDKERQKFLSEDINNVFLYTKYLFNRCFSKDDFEEKSFSPGMPVLGFDGQGEWRYDIFSHIRSTTRGTTYYVCSGRSYKKIVPFNGNEHLVGTKDI